MARRVVTIVVLAVVLILSATSVALAHSMYSGWSDNHKLCTTCTVDQGRVVATWQTILWADAFLGKCGSAGIDGIFGSTTKSATKSWQANYGLTVDGIVGPQSWSTARSFVVSDGGGYYHYIGYDHNFKLYKFPDTGEWYFDPVGDSVVNYYPTDHPSLDFGKC